MKHLYHSISVCALIISSSLFAQINVSTVKTLKSPLLEHIGGQNNGWDSDACKIADNLMASRSWLNYYVYHAGAFAINTLEVSEGTLLEAEVSPAGYPTGTISRKVFPSINKLDISRSSWAAYIDSVRADSSPVNINTGAYQNGNGDLAVDVAAYFTENMPSAYLHVCIVQDSIISYQSGASTLYPARVTPGGDFIHMNVLRKYLTTLKFGPPSGLTMGEKIANSSKGQRFDTTLTFTPATIGSIPWDWDNMKVIAFITTGNNMSEVVTSKTYALNGGNYTPSVSKISGTTTMNGSTTVNDLRRVYLIWEDTSKTSPYLVALDSVDTRDSFLFSPVPQGTYYLKAAVISGQTNYWSYIPTYYDQDNLWVNADAINHSFHSTGIVLDMTAGTNPGGPGFIGGYVQQGANFGPGDPMTGVNVILYDDMLIPVAYDVTDNSGRYEFNNLAYGTYNVYIDALNAVPTPLQVTVSEKVPTSDNNDFNLGSTSAVPVGVDQNEIEESAIVIYPNPAVDVLNIDNLKQGEYQIEIRNLTGLLMKSLTLDENTDHAIDVRDLGSSMYFLYIETQDKLEVHKFHVK